jgi:hypothetical protein
VFDVNDFDESLPGPFEVRHDNGRWPVIQLLPVGLVMPAGCRQ